jgi:preprotein translocase subunit SecA
MAFSVGMGACAVGVAGRLAREAQQVADALAGSIASAALTDQLLQARANLRRACSLGQADGAAARAPAMVALCRAAGSVLGQDPSLLQIKAALGMHAGYAVEIGFVGGRALAVGLAAILHAWSGRHCHIVSAGDHQAALDVAQLSSLFQVCGVSAVALAATTPPLEAEHCYGRDIVYATGRQLLSDFMRDELLLAGAVSPARRRLQARKLAGNEQRPVTRGMGVALIGDIEAVLVDEAASPVLISAAGNASVLNDATVAACALVEGLLAGRDYSIASQAGWQVHFSDQGHERVAALGMALPVYWQHPQRRFDVVSNALLARDMLQIDRHYVVQEGRLMLADESVFRLLAGRVWHNGMLQALEVRNGLPLSTPPRTVARAALQTFFPRYDSLAGVGSSLAGLDQELQACYSLKVLKLASPAVPAPARRYGYRTRAAKFDGFVALVERLHEAGLGVPVLIGAPRTADLAALGRALVEKVIHFQVVDGRDPAQDALNLGAAGTAGAITFITGQAARNGALDAAPSRLHALLFEHWDTGRGDDGFLAWAPYGIVFASIDDDVMARILPAWAGPLRQLVRRVDAGGRFGARVTGALVALAQWQATRQGSGYRRMIALREKQLDEQLAFSGKG